MKYENMVFVIQDLETEKIVLITSSKERALDFLPTHAVSAVELEKFSEIKNGDASR